MFYGADFSELFRRGAHYVDKIPRERNLLTCRCNRRRNEEFTIHLRMIWRHAFK
jgi:hypothetical protein